GRLVRAFTSTCLTCAKITDLGFGYSLRGELINVQQSTPHSGGYYHTTATYWANGELATLEGVPGAPSWTFKPDGEGRPSAILENGISSIATVSYNSASQITKILFGSGDNAVYTYNASNNRMTQYAYNIGA